MAQGGVSTILPRRNSWMRACAICDGEWFRSPMITHGSAKLLTNETSALSVFSLGPVVSPNLGA
eukprot:7738951-Pyramimonas_sp.AAC.1